MSHAKRLCALEWLHAQRHPVGQPIDTLRARAADVIASRALSCLTTSEEALFFDGDDDERAELLTIALDRLGTHFADCDEPLDDFAVAEWHASWSARAAWKATDA